MWIPQPLRQDMNTNEGNRQEAFGTLKHFFFTVWLVKGAVSRE